MELIIIDPGHGGDDPGALNIELGLEEKAINLAVAQKLWALLSGPSCGTLVRLTRTRDIFVSLSSRTDYANHLQECFPETRALFVSLHCNAFSDPAVRGVEVFHYPGSKSGQRLGGFVLDAITRAFPDMPSRGLKTNPNLAVLRRTRMPAILIEMEFISNPDTARLLARETFQWQMAQSIQAGIQSCLKPEESAGIS